MQSTAPVGDLQADLKAASEAMARMGQPTAALSYESFEKAIQYLFTQQAFHIPEAVGELGEIMILRPAKSMQPPPKAGGVPYGMTAKAPRMARATNPGVVEEPPAAAKPAAPTPDANDQGFNSGMPRGILPGNLAQDAKQDVNEWFYDLTGNYELAEKQYNFRNHYVTQRRSSGPSGVEHTINVSIHFCKTGDI